MTHTEIDPTWPAQIRLPGQTAAHPGPVDMTMMYVMHHAFRRDLAAFAAAAAATPVADREAWAALAERWELFSSALHHHHSGEDTGLWPLLMDRTDDDGRAVLAGDGGRARARSTRSWRPARPGSPGSRVHADEDARAALAVRLSPAARAARPSTCATRRPRRSRSSSRC